jgi:hypothetical protein
VQRLGAHRRHSESGRPRRSGDERVLVDDQARATFTTRRRASRPGAASTSAGRVAAGGEHHHVGAGLLEQRVGTTIVHRLVPSGVRRMPVTCANARAAHDGGANRADADDEPRAPEPRLLVVLPVPRRLGGASGGPLEPVGTSRANS